MSPRTLVPFCEAHLVHHSIVYTLWKIWELSWQLDGKFSQYNSFHIMQYSLPSYLLKIIIPCQIHILHWNSLKYVWWHTLQYLYKWEFIESIFCPVRFCHFCLDPTFSSTSQVSAWTLNGQHSGLNWAQEKSSLDLEFGEH